MAKNYSNLEGLIGNVKESIRNAYDKGYKQGFNEGQAHQLASDDVFRESCEKSAYEKGLNDAWECARKIACDKSQNGYSLYTLREIFGTASLSDIFLNFSTFEAITCIKEYEEKQKQADDEIKVGDEVVDECAIKHIVVTDEPNSGGCISLLSNYYQTTQLYPIKKLRKTGRHFDQIAEVLEQLKEAQDETD